MVSWDPAGGCGCAPALAAAPPPADGGGGGGAVTVSSTGAINRFKEMTMIKAQRKRATRVGIRKRQ